jgi:Tol biopolymer transport system component
MRRRLAAGALVALAVAAGGGCVQRVSVMTGGGQVLGGSGSDAPSISGDSRFVAFESTATDLVASDTNGVSDVFVHDRIAHVTERVSVAGDGAQASGPSTEAVISADGRWVAFTSAATDLVPGDTNGSRDVFLHDRVLHTTVRASVSPTGAQIAGVSEAPSLSGDGMRVAFETTASLVAGDVNPFTDVYVRDRAAATTLLVSRFANGFSGQFVSSEPSITRDGSRVAFRSYVAFSPSDTDNFSDIYLQEVGAAIAPTHISAPATTANAFQPAVDADGSVVVFAAATPRVDVFAYETPGTVTRLSNGPGGVDADNGSVDPAVSANGQWVTFTSFATNLVLGDGNENADIFRADRATAALVRVSVDALGAEGNGESRGRSGMSDDGKYVVFPSFASNLPSDGTDSNAIPDIMVKLVVG